MAAALQAKLLPGAWTGGKMLSDDDYAKEVQTLNDFFASILALADQQTSRRQEVVEIEAATDIDTQIDVIRQNGHSGRSRLR